MNFVKESKRKFLFTCEPDFQAKEDGVRAEDGFLWFDKRHPDNKGRHFESIEQCQKWFDDRSNMMDKQTKLLTGIKASTVDVSDDDWKLIQKFMTVPEAFTKDDVRVYHPYLAHNFVDRDGERFSLGVLKSFAKTIVGKPLLIGHQWGPPGEGRFFKADLQGMSQEATLEFIGPHPSKNINEHLTEIVKRDGSIYWLVPSFYILKDDEEFIRKIDAGIIQDMSIGFRSKRVEIKDEEGHYMWTEFQNDGDVESEAREASFVFLGSQYGARNKKDADEDGEPVTMEIPPEGFKNISEFYNQTEPCQQ